MIILTEEIWKGIEEEYKGVWTRKLIEVAGDVPFNWEGKRTVMSGCISNKRNALYTETIHFEII